MTDVPLDGNGPVWTHVGDVAVFIHVATLGRYQLVFDEVLSAVRESGLVGRCARIEVDVVGSGPLQVRWDDPRVAVIRRGDDVLAFEHPTLMAIREFSAAHPAMRVLYLNCLGGRYVDPGWTIRCRWRQLLYHFLLYRHRERLRELEDADVCAIEWCEKPLPHAASNNWWARCGYLSTLPPASEAIERVQLADLSHFGEVWTEPLIKQRHAGEFWLGMRPDVSARTLLDFKASGLPVSVYGNLPWWEMPGVDWLRIGRLMERADESLLAKIELAAQVAWVQRRYRGGNSSVKAERKPGR